MIVRCGSCEYIYDDAVLSTVCPHTRSANGQGILCREHDLFNCTMPHREEKPRDPS